MKSNKKQEDLEFEKIVHEDRVKRYKSEARWFLFASLFFICIIMLPWLLNEPERQEIIEHILWTILMGFFPWLFFRIYIRECKEAEKEQSVIETINDKLRYLE